MIGAAALAYDGLAGRLGASSAGLSG
jgi:hypothetical protein